MLITAVILYMPVACMVTELVSSIPAPAGHAYWIAVAFGPRWGFQAGYWSWVSNCIDCAIYSSMAVTAVWGTRPTGNEMSFFEFVCRATLALLLALPAFMGIRRIGTVVTYVALLVIITTGVRQHFLPVLLALTHSFLCLH